MRPLKIALFIYSLTFAVSAKVIKNKKSEEQDGITDQTHQVLSDSLLYVSNSIDRFFSNERSDDYINRTQLRVSQLYTVLSYDRDDGFETRELFDIRLNLVLPRTQRKMQLFVENTRDAITANEATDISDPTQTEDQAQSTSSTTSIGLRGLKDVGGFRITTDAGVRLSIPQSQVFYRFRANREVELNKRWRFRPRWALNWLQIPGLSTNLNLDFERSFLRPDLRLRMVNLWRWNEVESYITHTHGPILFQTIDDRKAFSYSALANFSEIDQWQVDSYVYRVTYRQLLYKNWFFGEFYPELAYRRVDNFHQLPSLNFKFEILIGTI